MIMGSKAGSVGAGIEPFIISTPFWIDDDPYTDRDRKMFVAGVEFEMVRAASRWPRVREIDRS